MFNTFLWLSGGGHDLVSTIHFIAIKVVGEANSLDPLDQAVTRKTYSQRQCGNYPNSS